MRTLRIKRLADLGFTLPQIAAMGDADQHPREALRTLDSHLTRTLDRLRRVRVEVHQIIQQSAPTDLPPALAARIHAAGLSAADRSLLVVMSRVLDPAVVAAYVDALQALPPSPAVTTFDELLADADEPTRHGLAIGLLSPSGTCPMLPGLWYVTTGSSTAATRVVDEAVRDLYNPAQRDVLRRIRLLRRSRPGPDTDQARVLTSGPQQTPAATTSQGGGESQPRTEPWVARTPYGHPVWGRRDQTHRGPAPVRSADGSGARRRPSAPSCSWGSSPLRG
ncbi:MAG: MerR family transcriptional regulator [Pseudonocardia sp.]|nr:MerR family transcriptional regulator [Pseudonocardia sp.]